MLKNKNLLYVKHDHMTGTSKNGYEWAITNITLSDGIESFKLPLDPSILPMVESLTRGTPVIVVIDLVTDSDGAYVTDYKSGEVRIAVTDVQSQKK